MAPGSISIGPVILSPLMIEKLSFRTTVSAWNSKSSRKLLRRDIQATILFTTLDYLEWVSISPLPDLEMKLFSFRRLQMELNGLGLKSVLNN